jgi:hypothetical protein
MVGRRGGTAWRGAAGPPGTHVWREAASWAARAACAAASAAVAAKDLCTPAGAPPPRAPNLFPPPVGRMVRLSRPSSVAVTASSCPGRHVVCPQRRRAACSAASSGTAAGMVAACHWRLRCACWLALLAHRLVCADLVAMRTGIRHLGVSDRTQLSQKALQKVVRILVDNQNLGIRFAQGPLPCRRTAQTVLRVLRVPGSPHRAVVSAPPAASCLRPPLTMPAVGGQQRLH